MNDYKYIFKYVDGAEEITQEFSADIDIDTLKERLQRFLLACSWTEKQLGFLEDTEETLLTQFALTEEGRKQLEKGQIQNEDVNG